MDMLIRCTRISFFISVVCVSFLAAGPAHDGQAVAHVRKENVANHYKPMDINNVFNYYGNNGDGSFNRFTPTNEGFEIPIGSNDGTTIFEDGIVWTAFKNDTLLCGGSTYNHGLQPGKILSSGSASALPVIDDPAKVQYRTFRVRPDMRPTGNSDSSTAEKNLLMREVQYDSRYEGYTVENLLQQYWDDWKQWPASDGAPYTDANGIPHFSGGPGYDPTTCTPGFPGADQTMWMVMNDVNQTITQNLYGSKPIGLEIQRTIWAYNVPGALGNTIYYSYKIINKSGVALESMYISQWADPDLGYAYDDAVGCDSVLGMGYAYNGNPHDINFDKVGIPSPAVGYDFLQGPMIPGAPSDTAIFDMQGRPGFKNLPMTAFSFFINSNATFKDPDLNVPTGTYQWYNLMRGSVSGTGLPFPSSVTGGGKFCYPGDPVSQNGPTYNGSAAVAPPGDVRICLVTGPFTMAPGDTQQVIVAAIAGFGKDNLQSVYALKRSGLAAATAYRNKFKVQKTPLPVAPVVSVRNDSNAIQLSWDAAAESFTAGGYSFQGYNVYQMSPDGVVRIATYDKADGITSVFDKVYNPGTGQFDFTQVQYGSDSGLHHSFTLKKDYLNDGEFIKGKRYFYAVTAYTFNPGSDISPNSTESRFYPLGVSYNRDKPGPNFGDMVRVTQVGGTSDAVVHVTIQNPSQLTGHDYRVSFHDEDYSLGSDGNWKDVTETGGILGKVSDLTGSSVTSSAVWGNGKRIVATYSVHVNSPNYDYCDGVMLHMPMSVSIDTIIAPVSINDGSVIPFTFNAATNTLFFGDSSRSTNGIFKGGEQIILRITGSTPIITDYVMYDDDWGNSNGYAAPRIDIHRSDTLSTVSDQTVTQHQWNVTDLTNPSIVLKNQTIFNGRDIYAPADYYAIHQTYGPGGSSGDFFGNIGPLGGQQFDGITVTIDGGFNPPVTINTLLVNNRYFVGALAKEYTYGGFDMADFSTFGFPDGTANSSITNYGGIGGSTAFEDLEQDYILKWTGVLGDTIINGKTVQITKSGGSFATLFGASNYSIASHPLNPNSGSLSPFLVRIPFEVWNTDKHEQVNLLMYDRNAAKLQDPAQDGFKIWNTDDRVYVWCVNTKYAVSVIDPTSQVVKDSATWNWVFFKSQFATGDSITIQYANPIEVGKDTYTFSVNDIISAVARGNTVIRTYSLSQNYPNPFNPTTTIEYSIPQTSAVTIKVYDILGREVKTLVHTEKQAGKYSLIFNASSLASGIYFYRMQAGTFEQTKKLVVLK